MSAELKVDTTKFLFALRAYKAATGKDCAEILNRAGLNVAYRAAQNTPVASAATIRSQLDRGHLKYALTALALKKRGIGALKSPKFAEEVARFVARRVSSARYLRAAWAQAI